MRKLLAARHQEIVDQLNLGRTMPEVSASLGIGRVPLFKYIKRHNLACVLAIKDLSRQEADAAKALLKTNAALPIRQRLTNEGLAAKVGCGTTLIKKLKRRFCIPRLTNETRLKYSIEDLVLACGKSQFKLLESPERVVTNHKILIMCFCGRSFETLVDSVLRGNVHSCGCLVSLPQKELFDYCRSKGFECQGDVVGLLGGEEQIDIYIPSLKLAIEYEGLYYHSISELKRRGKKADYHVKKFRQLKAQGIKLLSIFENEYLERRDVVYSIIGSKLGVISQKIPARKCIVVSDGARLRAFVRANHLQGARGRVYLGLEFGGEVVAAMAFRTTNRLLPHGWELSRYCNRLNQIVVGGFSRLLMEFKRRYSPTEIVSLSDNRWSWGEVYAANGFEILRESKHTYYYIKARKLFHKSAFAKRRLRQLGWLEEGATESQAMKARGFDRIYDCGKITWIWRAS